MEGIDIKKETQNEIIENKAEEEKKSEQEKNQEDENKIVTIKNKDIKEEVTEKDIKNKEKESSQEKSNELKDKQIKDEIIDPHLIFQKELLNIINKQEKILSATSTINEKFGVSNEITKEQIASFKTNIDKYGKYLIMIKKELGIISSTMKKIKKLANEKDNSPTQEQK